MTSSLDDAATAFTAIAPFYDELMKDVPYHAWVRYILNTMDRLSFRPRSILDLACGTGTVTLMLARHGFDIIGIDGSEAMLEVARAKAAQQRCKVPFLQGDLRTFESPRPVDMVICLYDSLNNLVEPGEVQQAFQQVADSLEPGGIFLFDMNTDYALRANLFTQRNMDPNARVQYAWESHYDYRSKRCTIDMEFWVLNEAGKRQRYIEVHHQRALSPPDLHRMLSRVGLKPLGMYDGLSQRPPGPYTDRLYVVARRQTPDAREP